MAVGITASTSSTIAVLLGNGDGTLQSPVSSPLSYAGADFMVAGDFNGDGKMDLAIDAGDSVSVLLGNGDGSLQMPISTILGSTLKVHQLVAGDFNGDGKLDLATVVYDSTNGQPSIRILLGEGNGAFTVGLSYPSSGSINSLVAGDFNKDGKADLAVVQQVPNFVMVFIGNGNGSFQSPVSYAVESNEVMSVADVNGDGNLDLVLGSGCCTSVLLGNGDGTFQNHIDSILPGFSSYNVVSLAVKDFNGDGKPDVGTYGEGKAAVLLGNGDGTFRAALTYVSASNFGFVAAGDFNSDGTPDLAVTSVNPSGVVPTVFLLLSAPMGSFFPSSVNFSPQDFGTSSFAQNVALANVGSAPLFVSGITTTGDYAQTNTCDGTVAVAGNCAISVTFTPTNKGPRTGVLTVTDNAIASPQAIDLTGTGLPAAVVSLSSASLDFGYHVVGTPSLSQRITVANTGDSALTISSIAPSSAFAQTNTCSASLTAGTNCTIQVTFKPSALGAASGSITITDNAPGSPHVVNLAGVGAAEPTLVFPGTTPVPNPPRITSIDFGSEPVSTPTAPQPVTVANASNQPLLVRRILATRRFAQSSNCSAAIAPGVSCSISVTFTPALKGPRRGVLIVLDTGRPRLSLVRLSGDGI